MSNNGVIYINPNGIEFYISENEVSVLYIIDNETQTNVRWKNENELCKKFGITTIDKIDSMMLLDEVVEEELWI